MKKRNIVFFSVVFPQNERYLDDFFNSLDRQTIKEFDILLYNDDLKNIYYYIEKYSGKLNIIIIEKKLQLPPSKIREYAINYLIKSNYDIIVFGDSDDYFEDNRVQVCVDKLNKYDIVLNDITLFNDNSVFRKNYISKRVKNNTEIDLEFIKDKNIFGMSNTAVKANILKNIDLDESLVAVDWYLFSILLSKKYKAVFTTDTKTFYRQYLNNSIGLGNITNESISKGIAVKYKHYELMKKENVQFESLFIEMVDLQRKVEDVKYIEKLKKQNIKNALWWEEIRNLKC